MLLALVWTITIAWLMILVAVLPHLRRHGTVDPLPAEADPPTRCWPLVSILVAARNEAQRALKEAIGSMLSQDYPHFEIIAVDDRSTDGTLRVLNELAAQDPRLRVIRGAALPPGWLGKPHALQQAVAVARGEWLLGTDADVLFDPAAVRTAVALAEEQGYDVLVLLPKVDCLTFWERVILPVAQLMIHIVYPLRRVNDPKRFDALTIGRFVMMKRTALCEVGGYEAVKQEVSEDVALGYRFKQRGHCLHVAQAPRLLHTRSYTSLREIWEGHTRNLFAGLAYAPPVLRRAAYANFSQLREHRSEHARLSLGIVGGCALVGGVIAMLLMVVPPVVLLVSLLLMMGGGSGDVVPLAAIALASTAVAMGLHTKLYEQQGVAWPHALLAPLGYTVYIAMLLVSTWDVLTGRGVRWKGRRIYEASIGKSAE